MCTRIVILDDDTQALTHYSMLLRKIGLKNSIDLSIKEYLRGGDLMCDLEEPRFYNTLDILFLDIRMPGISGVSVASEARRLGYSGVIVFITASDEHYRDAFDIGAFNYIRKGESVSRVEEVFLSAVETAKQINSAHITLGSWGEIRKIPIGAIDYFEVDKKKVFCYYDGGKFGFPGTLCPLEERLKDSGFIRIHRNYLISLSRLDSVSYTHAVIGGKRLPVGRTHAKPLHDASRNMVFIKSGQPKEPPLAKWKDA